MGIFNTFGYGDGTLYGINSRIEYSVAPFTATAIDYARDSFNIPHPIVAITWATPSGVVEGFRIVRNQDGYSETQEDGHIIYEVYGAAPTVNSIYDQYNSVPITSGQYAFYTVWILRADNTWFPADHTYCLIPKEHMTLTPEKVVLESAQDKFVGLLPKVYTSQEQSYVDAIDPNSDIYAFLGGFSFTYDEWLTYADLLLPRILGKPDSPEFISAHIKEVGMPQEPTLGLRTQKRLLRQAINLYKSKGTLNGVHLFAETLSGFSTNVTTSPNVLVDSQNSSFYKGVGNWVGTNAAITAATDLAPNQLETYAVDRTYAGKVITSASNGYVTNGYSNVITTGTPVNPGTSYTFSYYVTAPSNTSNVTPQITWYDHSGAVLEVTNGTAHAATNQWVKYSFSHTSKGLSVGVTNTQVTSNVATVTVGAGHPFSTGNTVILTNLGYPYNGTHTITGTTSTTISFTVTGPDKASTAVYGTASEPLAVFAGIKFTFATAGTYYIDQLQLADSTDSRSTNYYEARAVELYFSPTKINYLENPSFVEITDSDDYDWTFTGQTAIDYVSPTTVPGILDSSEMVEVTTSSTTPLLIQTYTDAVPSNSYYTFSVYVKTLSGSETLTFGIQVVDSSGTVLTENGLNVEAAYTPIPSVSTTWTRYQVTVFAPLTAGTIYLIPYISGNTTGNTLAIDAAQVEAGYTATDYFDGSYIGRGAFWLGDAHDSESMLYANLATKLGRLQAELKNYLPINTPYILTIGDPTNKTLESSGFSS
jgi:hypothetical protein